jgi:hypothetical protein
MPHKSGSDQLLLFCVWILDDILVLSVKTPELVRRLVKKA